MFAENDVIAISSLGGASGNFWLRILKGQPRLYIHVQLTLFVYLERFRRYWTFCIWLGFPWWGRKFGGFWAKWCPKRQIERKTLTGRALPCAKLCVLSYCAWNIIICLACAGAQEKRQEGKNEEKSQEVYISRMCGATFSGWIATKLSNNSRT